VKIFKGMHVCMWSDYCEVCTGQYVGTLAVRCCSILDTLNTHIFPQIPVHPSYILLALMPLTIRCGRYCMRIVSWQLTRRKLPCSCVRAISLVSLQQLRPNLAFSRRESYHVTLINLAPNVLGLSWERNPADSL
jgi:hypothetical protein